MKKKLTVPNTPRYVQAIALGTEPADTLALLLEAGAIGTGETGQARQVRQFVEAAYAHLNDVPREQIDWDVYATLAEILAALESPDYQAYLAFRLRDAQAGEELVDALAVVHGAHYHSKRPWKADADPYAAAALQRMQSAPVTCSRRGIPRANAFAMPLLDELAGGAR
jgi:hypothetical protein